MSNPPTLVFIPGAWNKPRCYDKVIKLLQDEHQLKCVSIALPTTSGDPQATFKDDLDVAREAIASETTQGRNVVVVAHSYGGMVGNSAIKGPPAEEAEYWVSQLTTQGLKALFEGREYTYAGWQDVPTWYIGTVEDHGLPVLAQRIIVGMAREMGGSVEHRELPTSHSPFLSQPEATVKIMLDAAKKQLPHDIQWTYSNDLEVITMDHQDGSYLPQGGWLNPPPNDYVEKVKSQHWKEFLDKARHLWKAASYMKPRESYGSIPPLKDGTNEVVDNECKAKMFMEAFFPKMAAPGAMENPEPNEEIRWDPITKEEVYGALQRMKARKAPGEDEIPTMVWKQIWPYLSEEIFQIFTASINLGYYPRQWKRARIVVLRKPNKPDYAIPGAYQPISLLNTLGKVLEAVVAKRLSYYAETYSLLPNTQFGGRPGRNTEQALLILSNAIDKAWIRSKVVTLVAFDLKGAFNGVNGSVIDGQLKAKGIPSILRSWVISFIEERTTSITFDNFKSTRLPLENAGLAQGSPPSPILFIFFNAVLVNQPVNHKGGSSAFIDDYFRWVVGPSAEENLRKLQEDDIPRIEQWANQTGSCFAAEKTELIHLTQRKSELSKGQLIIQGTTIKPSTTAKLLSVVFDNELRWKLHVQQVLKRATKVSTALSGLRYLRPGQMRQLYQACVTPIVDYASTVWHCPTKDKMHLRALNTVQRSALIQILSVFKSVATTTMEVELFTLPTRLRLRQRAQITIVNLLTLPWDHPIQGVLSRARRRRDNPGNGSAPRFPLAESMKTMGLKQFSGLETINPKPTAQWKLRAFKEIDINPDREKARKNAAALLTNPHRVVYSDASGHDNHLGAAAVVLDRNQNIVASRKTAIGSMAHWSIHIAELIGVYDAISIGGGLPSNKNDIRLGDVIVSKPDGQYGGVVQYDLGKWTADGFERTGSLNAPPERLLAVLNLMPGHGRQFAEPPSRLYPDEGLDQLFEPDGQQLVNRQPGRRREGPYVFYGTIASGNSVIKDADTRDKLRVQHGVLCCEMEAAGLMNSSFPCLVIRGISDYADSHKNDRWQEYAAATSARYAKDFLSQIPEEVAQELAPIRVREDRELFLQTVASTHGQNRTSRVR
ncbi:endonuclease/reverse transcriptase, putative [Talaromyces stipitatus ATCC 10500]|uniref:Endonuclease/reverse transcriptase, putative n=1 Tax=Talaromyces stipitatus (strain ATCC 10500 / CBS 375.48 / QM 6759 / NRRL 1006) TaxID=441959 RepID=B8MSW5_TALSN|nr:endonuclease/reverse transcriptase, putative [Talaromyces stipitatus ATCC 10500]EED12026.1 endonuclease/reverse transcriptase, putative [Talaromyces stipitatus ATCC 10500]